MKCKPTRKYLSQARSQGRIVAMGVLLLYAGGVQRNWSIRFVACSSWSRKRCLEDAVVDRMIIKDERISEWWHANSH